MPTVGPASQFQIKLTPTVFTFFDQSIEMSQDYNVATLYMIIHMYFFENAGRTVSIDGD